MPTAQTVINGALNKLGLLEPAGTPSPSDSVYMLAELNNQWSSWSIDEGLIWGQQTFQGSLVANKGVYSIGTGGDFDTARPQRIYKAFALGVVALTGTTTATSRTLLFADTSALTAGQLLIGPGIPANSFVISIIVNTSALISNAATASGTVGLYVTNGNRNEMRIVAAGEYYDHNDLGAVAGTPDELYPDYLENGSTGVMNLYVWPVLRSAPLAIEIDIAVIFSTWALVTNYQIPPGYQDTIEWALAFRAMPAFGAAVNPNIAQIVGVEGVKAEARLRKANSMNRQLPDAAVVSPSTPAPQQAA